MTYIPLLILASVCFIMSFVDNKINFFSWLICGFINLGTSLIVIQIKTSTKEVINDLLHYLMGALNEIYKVLKVGLIEEEEKPNEPDHLD